MVSQLPPAGWHPDPHGSAQLRYWDGHNWTEHYAPMTTTAPPPAGTSPHPTMPQQSVDATHTIAAPGSMSPSSSANGMGAIVDWAKTHKVLAIVVGVVAFFFVVGVIGAIASPPTTSAQFADSSDSASQPADDPEPVEEAPTEPAIKMPKDQTKFISIVENASSSIRDDSNELQVVQAKTQRGKDMCALVGPSLDVTDWVGTVEDVSTEMGGDKGVFSVTLSDKIAMQTWNNSLSDFDSNTLIDTGSALFTTIAEFAPDDVVIFSGKFISDEKCLGEQSMSDLNGLRTPDFTFKFTKVERH